MLLPYVLGIILAVVHFLALHLFSKKYCIKCSMLNKPLVSFGTGFILASVILGFIPDVVNENLVYTVLIGFAAFFILEKTVYNYAPRYKKNKELNNVHIGIIFFVNVIGGIAVYNIFTGNMGNAVLLFLVFVMLSLLDDFALHNVHSKESTFAQAVVSGGFLIGVVFQGFVKLQNLNLLHGILAGILLFIVSNELIPKEKNKDIKYFVMGLAVYVVASMLI